MTRPGDRQKTRQRVARALDLHAEGLSLRDIAAELGVTVNAARRYLSAGIASLPEQHIEELRMTSELRLDKAAKNYRDLLHHDDPRIRLQATQGLVTVERDRARLLGTWQKPPSDDDDRLPSR